MNNDPAAPMINHEGAPYTRADCERRKTNASAPDASHYRWRELELAVASDFLHRLLAAKRLKGGDAVKEFMGDLEDFIKAELKKHVKLEDAVYGECRRAQKAAHKTGRIIALGFLTPFDAEPVKRGQERLRRALAAFTSRQIRQVRRRVKSEK